jgi:Tol biopolymer transport system component
LAERIVFHSHGRLGIISADARSGTEPRYLDFDVPGVATWGYGPVLDGGRRIILLSVDDGKPWEGTARSRIWIYDLSRSSDPTDGLTEIGTVDRPADYMPVAAILPGEERMIVNPLIDGTQRVWTMNLDGSDQRALSDEKVGFAYGVSVSPDSKQVTFHASNPTDGYGIYVTDIDPVDGNVDGNVDAACRKVASDPGHIVFGPSWSPDGQWIAYTNCDGVNDPGHDWADIWVVSPDGEEQMAVGWGRNHWLSPAWGTKEWHGRGSNVSTWSPLSNTLTYTRGTEGSRPPWVFQADRPDTDHFNRELVPEQAMGGTDICLADVDIGSTVPITQSGSNNMWDFRTVWSPDGSRIVFCRAMVGRPSELWIMDTDGRNQRALTLGWEHRGADHPRWIPDVS